MTDDDWATALDDEPPRRRPAFVAVLATVPWLVVAALLLVPGRLGGTATEADATGAATVTARPVDPAPDDPGTLPAASPEGVEPPAVLPAPGTGSSPPAAPPDAALEALAVVVARAWLTGIGPALAVGDGSPPHPDRYAEHLVVEAVDRPGPDAAVVTVLAVLLEGDDLLTAAVRRIAIPLLATADGPAPGGEPWELPPPTLELTRPDPTLTLHDPGELLAATDALHAAGLASTELEGLATTSGWPFLAEVRDPARAATSTVWLVRDGESFRVAGHDRTTSHGTPSTSPLPVQPRDDEERDP